MVGIGIVSGVVVASGSAARDTAGREFWRSVVGRLALWYRRNRERRELMRLSDSELRDFGVGRTEAIEEASKPFWRG